MPAPVQPIRSTIKGSGDWVDEVFTDPASGKVLRVTSYTHEQLNTMKSTIDTQYNTQVANINGMIALLTPVV